MKTVSLKEARDHLLELLDEGVKGGQDIVITGDGAAYKITVMPVDQNIAKAPQARDGFGKAKDIIKMADNWEDPIPGLEPYIS